MKIIFNHSFEEIISIDNLLIAWGEFAKGKKKKKDVREFHFNLMNNILDLHHELKSLSYKHGGYQSFNICDPKLRNIHKATVRDRLLHHALYRQLYLFFDRIFVADSFSCRLDKGTLKAINRFRQFSYIVGKNNTVTCWVLKCDIEKFFQNINHDILINILKKYILDHNILWLLGEVVNSFSSIKPDTGLPLGNLTSQLFVNVYMNELDQFIKHKLKAKYYIRYADDFVILSDNKHWLEDLIYPIQCFLWQNLKLKIHPDKSIIKSLSSGIDFLGWVHFSDHRILRITTKKRMLKRIKESPISKSYNSYLGLLKHGNTWKIKERLRKEYILCQKENSCQPAELWQEFSSKKSRVQKGLIYKDPRNKEATCDRRQSGSQHSKHSLTDRG